VLLINKPLDIAMPCTF